ncbi:MAG: GntR family transcriptional regulator [Acidimicrobiaceae bacterium]|nr:GntR family transcriptional regulator [Acidimicrobiaceae bacterium]
MVNTRLAATAPGTLPDALHRSRALNGHDGPDRPEGLDRESPVPLWAQLRDLLRARIDAGDFADGFPTEMALVEAYGVSRNTVRDALRHLRTDGVVIAGRGRRPRLDAQSEIEQPLGALYSLYDSVAAVGLRATSVVRRLEIRRDPQAAAHLGLEDDVSLLYLERLRLADDEPLAIDRVWFPADVAEPLLAVDFSTIGFYDELATRTGIRLTGGREHIRAVVPNRSERTLLRLPAGVAAFAIERLGMVRTRPVEFRHTLVRGDRFSVVAEFSGGKGYRLDVASTGSST